MNRALRHCYRTLISYSSNGRVWIEGQKHIHRAAAISKTDTECQSVVTADLAPWGHYL